MQSHCSHRVNKEEIMQANKAVMACHTQSPQNVMCLGTAHSPEPWETNPGCLRYFRCLWFTVEACIYNVCVLLIFPSFISFIKDLIKIILINTIFYIAEIVISLSSDNGIRAPKNTLHKSKQQPMSNNRLSCDSIRWRLLAHLIFLMSNLT